MTSILLARLELRHVRDRERANVARLEYLTTDRLSILNDLANQVSRELSCLMSVDLTEMTHKLSEADGVEESAVDSEEECENYAVVTLFFLSFFPFIARPPVLSTTLNCIIMPHDYYHNTWHVPMVKIPCIGYNS